ncbi:MAG: hypothetical protein RIB53_14440 [Roseitalea porphyridii]|uniref:hypothetical protein n=1 Tax=Roseitalea porphyridii TaxID=1852022 RepID=UPI0032EF049A
MTVRAARAALFALLLVLGNDSGLADRLPQIDPTLWDVRNLASEKIDEVVASVPRFVHVFANDCQLPVRSGLVEHRPVARAYQYGEVEQTEILTGLKLLYVFDRNTNSALNPLVCTGENVNWPGNWEGLISNVLVGELENYKLLGCRDRRPKGKLCVDRYVNCCGFADVFNFDQNTVCASRPLALIAGKPPGHLEIHREPWPLLRDQRISRDLSGIYRSFGGKPSLLQITTNEPYSPYAHAQGHAGKYGHEPLGEVVLIGADNPVYRPWWGWIVAFGFVIGVFGLIAGAGCLLMGLILYVTGDWKEDQKEARRQNKC